MSDETSMTDFMGSDVDSLEDEFGSPACEVDFEIDAPLDDGASDESQMWEWNGDSWNRITIV